MKASQLDGMMELDHVVRVHADGTGTDAEPGIYAPELYHDDNDDYGPLLSNWSLMTGYTGQYSYSGPVMHSSEFIGGRMAEDILAAPGLYVSVVVEVLDCEECDADICGACDPDDLGLVPAEDCDHGQSCSGDHEPAGWAVAYILDEE